MPVDIPKYMEKEEIELFNILQEEHQRIYVLLLDMYENYVRLLNRRNKYIEQKKKVDIDSDFRLVQCDISWLNQVDELIYNIYNDSNRNIYLMFYENIRRTKIYIKDLFTDKINAQKYE